MRSAKRLTTLLALTITIVFATMCLAQSTTTSAGMANDVSKNGGIPTKDHNFMVKAAEGGVAEVQLGNLAQQNGESQQVKDFGKRMVDDHSKANDQLKQLASKKGVALPDKPSAKDKADYDRLSKLHGAAFDKAYAREMVSDHKTDVVEFQKEAKAGNDADVKSWAGQTAPTLEEHLKMAEQMNNSSKPESAMGKSNSMK